MKRDSISLFPIKAIAMALIVGVTGCLPYDTPITAPTRAAVSTPQTITPRRQNASSTPTQVEPTQTGTPTPSSTPTLRPPTSTPKPTLSANEAKSLLLNLLRVNGDCALPCIWGITPGETVMEALDPFMARFNKGPTVSGSVALQVNQFDDVGGVHLSFIEEGLNFGIDFSYYKAGSKLTQLVLSAGVRERTPKEGAIFGSPRFNQLLQYYTLPQILSTYGQPHQVLVAPFHDDPDYPPAPWIPFSLVLYYPERGILVEYLGPRETKGERYMGCPHKAHVHVTGWNVQLKYALEEVVSRISGRGINELNTDYFKSVEEATSISLDRFYEEFKDPQNSICLETPISMWPYP